MSNYNQTETNVYFEVTDASDATRGLPLRVGRRERCGAPAGRRADRDRASEAAPKRRARRGRVPAEQKLLLTAEAEVASSGGVYFNTSLYDYQKVRAQARYQATASLSVALDFTYLNNENPTPGINYNFRSQQEAASIFWSPSEREDFHFPGIL